MSVHRLTPASHDDDKRNDIIYSENITTLSADSQNEAGHAGVSPAAFQVSLCTNILFDYKLVSLLNFSVCQMF